MSTIHVTLSLDPETVTALRTLATEQRSDYLALGAAILARALSHGYPGPRRRPEPAAGEPAPKFYVRYRPLVPALSGEGGAERPDFASGQRLPVYAFITEQAGGGLALVVSDEGGRFWTIPGYACVLEGYDRPEPSEVGGPAARAANPRMVWQATGYLLAYLSGAAEADGLREAVWRISREVLAGTEEPYTAAEVLGAIRKSLLLLRERDRLGVEEAQR